MNRRVFLITAASVALTLFALFYVGCALDESPHEALFGRLAAPVLRVLSTPIAQLVMLICGKTATGFRSLLILIFIAVGSGIFWGLVVERTVHWLGSKRRETRRALGNRN
ncbi:MAG: hypothetical protein V1873_08065 [Verrucomicrobiota bacterium]